MEFERFLEIYCSTMMYQPNEGERRAIQKVFENIPSKESLVEDRVLPYIIAYNIGISRGLESPRIGISPIEFCLN